MGILSKYPKFRANIHALTRAWYQMCTKFKITQIALEQAFFSDANDLRHARIRFRLLIHACNQRDAMRAILQTTSSIKTMRYQTNIQLKKNYIIVGFEIQERTTRQFSRWVGKDCIFLRATILTHPFRFIQFHQRIYTCSPVLS